MPRTQVKYLDEPLKAVSKDGLLKNWKVGDFCEKYQITYTALTSSLKRGSLPANVFANGIKYVEFKGMHGEFNNFIDID